MISDMDFEMANQAVSDYYAAGFEIPEDYFNTITLMPSLKIFFLKEMIGMSLTMKLPERSYRKEAKTFQNTNCKGFMRPASRL